jgi:hypothetical protein
MQTNSLLVVVKKLSVKDQEREQTKRILRTKHRNHISKNKVLGITTLRLVATKVRFS